MKKVVLLLSSIVMLAGLVACGKPSETVSVVVDASSSSVSAVASSEVSSAGAAVIEDDAVGHYTLKNAVFQGVEMNKELLEEQGLDVSGFVLDIKEDGTFSMDTIAAGDVEAVSGVGEWTKDGDTYLMDDGAQAVPGTYNAEENTFSIEVDGIVIVFEK